MIEGYLGNHAERLTELAQLMPNELYVVGRGRQAFVGFRMPERFLRNGDSILLRKIKVYETHLDRSGQKVVEETTEERDLTLDGFIDVKHMGLFKPTEGSELRRVLKEHLE